MKKKYLAATIAMASAFGPMIQAQDTASTKLVLRPESKLSFDGTSTLHGFSCTTTEINANVEVDARYRTASLATITRPISTVDVTIPVKSLKCGNGKLESNMYNVLKEKDYPTIKYVLKTYELVRDSATADSFIAKITGTLAIAGEEKPIEMRVVGRRTTDGVAMATSTLEINMSDFGIKPPTFMLGTLRVGHKITLKFDLAADRATVAALGLDLP